MDLSTDAMLVSLRISAWSGRLHDRRASNHVAAHHEASAGAGRYNKRLLPKSAFAALTATASKARTTYYEQTLPWDDQGFRLLPVANYDEQIEQARRDGRDPERWQRASQNVTHHLLRDAGFALPDDAVAWEGLSVEEAYGRLGDEEQQEPPGNDNESPGNRESGCPAGGGAGTSPDPSDDSLEEGEREDSGNSAQSPDGGDEGDSDSQETGTDGGDAGDDNAARNGGGAPNRRFVDSAFDLPDSVEIHGRGGTDFRPGFEWLEEQGIQPGLCLYFTDMCCSRYPEHEPGFPTVWLNWDEPPPDDYREPWGERIDMGM